MSKQSEAAGIKALADAKASKIERIEFLLYQIERAAEELPNLPLILEDCGRLMAPALALVALAAKPILRRAIHKAGA